MISRLFLAVISFVLSFCLLFFFIAHFTELSEVYSWLSFFEGGLFFWGPLIFFLGLVQWINYSDFWFGRK